MGKGTVSPQQRKDHAAIARYMFENYSQVSYAVGLISRYSAPVYPQADSVETDWNELALTRFLNWAKRCDWSGRYDLWTMQRIASNLLDTDGECAFWLRDSDDGVKIDLVEAWQIYTPESKEKDPLCVDGVQLDKCGRITGYWVEDLGTSVFVDAGKIKLLSHPGRYSALRAESPMRQGINDLRDANDIKAFQKQAVKLDSIIASYIKRGVGNDSVPSSFDDNVATSAQKAAGITQADLVGGELKSTDNGDEIVSLKSDRPGTNVMAFLDALAGNFVASLQMPPAFYLDERLTAPNQRSVNGKAQRRFDERQDLFCDLLDFLWPRIQAGFQSPAKNPPDGWDRISYQCPAKHSIDAGREAAQEREDVAAGLMTRRNSFANRGMDFVHENKQWFRETDQIVDETIARAKQRGLTPAEYIAIANSTAATASAPPVQAATPAPEDPAKEPSK